MYSNNVTKAGPQTNKNIWKLVKPFITYKRFVKNVEIMLAEKDKTVTEEKELVRIWNHHYNKYRGCSCGTKPANQQFEDSKKAVEVICKSFGNHEFSKAIKKSNIETFFTAANSYLLKVSACDVKQLLRNIDSKKSTGLDKITPKIKNYMQKPSANHWLLQLIIVSTKE